MRLFHSRSKYFLKNRGFKRVFSILGNRQILLLFKDLLGSRQKNNFFNNIFTWVESFIFFTTSLHELNHLETRALTRIRRPPARLLLQVSPALSSNALVGGRRMSPYIINALTVSSCFCPQGIVPLMMPTLSLSLCTICTPKSAHQWSPRRWLPHLPMHSNLGWIACGERGHFGLEYFL
jgi:hypothetical protein